MSTGAQSNTRAASPAREQPAARPAARRAARRAAGDGGQSAVEFAGLLFFVFLFFLAAMQLLLVGYCVVVQDGAVRAAGTAHARGADADEAARAAMPDWLAARTDPVAIQGERVEVSIHAPSVLPGVDITTITRSAVFRRE